MSWTRPCRKPEREKLIVPFALPILVEWFTDTLCVDYRYYPDFGLSTDSWLMISRYVSRSYSTHARAIPGQHIDRRLTLVQYINNWYLDWHLTNMSTNTLHLIIPKTQAIFLTQLLLWIKELKFTMWILHFFSVDQSLE